MNGSIQVGHNIRILRDGESNVRIYVHLYLLKLEIERADLPEFVAALRCTLSTLEGIASNARAEKGFDVDPL